mmetsp:Transcript_61158/g.158177  ORF Transcript_61158/g.158177 Transcript_61158/m.158177 type:complete len:211 (+) Transcript_61158:1313-1945(+)
MLARRPLSGSEPSFCWTSCRCRAACLRRTPSHRPSVPASRADIGRQGCSFWTTCGRSTSTVMRPPTPSSWPPQCAATSGASAQEPSPGCSSHSAARRVSGRSACALAGRGGFCSSSPSVCSRCCGRAALGLGRPTAPSSAGCTGPFAIIWPLEWLSGAPTAFTTSKVSWTLARSQACRAPPWTHWKATSELPEAPMRPGLSMPGPMFVGG